MGKTYHIGGGKTSVNVSKTILLAIMSLGLIEPCKICLMEPHYLVKPGV